MENREMRVLFSTLLRTRHILVLTRREKFLCRETVLNVRSVSFPPI